MGKFRGSLPLLLVISSALLVMNTVALRWTASPGDGALVYSCSGQDLLLDWDYTLNNNDVVTAIQWAFQGVTRKVVAVSVYGNFLPTPTFSGRVTLLPRAGIRLSDVTFADSGNYSVQVTGHASRSSFTVTKTVTVHVADGLMTDGHLLQAHVEPAAVHDSATDQWAISLACGNFTYVGIPPVDVQWTTPEGQTLNSTSYDNGFFKLRLPGPVIAGIYTCGISPSTLNASCLHGDSAEATVQLDAILARLILLEAEQNYLRAENSRKDGVIGNLTSGFQSVASFCNDVCPQAWDLDEPVRLVNGANSSEGRVEIWAQGHWGTVCDDLWDNKDAEVVCRMLGLSTSGARAVSQAHFGRGVGRIMLDNVQCTGNEQSLLKCPAKSLGHHDCSHGEDAGVICS